MITGYKGKILFVDLTTGKIQEEALSDKIIRDYIGGYGIGARILYDRMKPGADPLGPDNMLGLIAGPFTGTMVPASSRFAAVGKSPLTKGWGDANSGGSFGPYLKFSGFDGVFFSGISPKPVYLLIDNGKAEIKDASKLWGKDTYYTEMTLEAEYGKDAKVACIGPAAEKLSLISAIITDHGSAAARSGLGAVMGSKKLKAVVCRGKPELAVANKEALMALRKEHLDHYNKPGRDGKPWLQGQHYYGTSSITYFGAHSGDSPVKNWGGVGVVDVPDKEPFNPDNVAKDVDKRGGCWHCPVACKATLKEGSGEYKYEAGARRPEYETAAAFGVCCANNNIQAINMANDICNRYGLDTISAGTVIAFAMECYENGILTKKDTGGIELKWGNHQAMVAMTEKLARREGLGDILADGVKVAAEKIGKGAEKFAVHIGGQELGMHDPKLTFPGGGASSAAARYHIDATPGRHTAGCGPSGFEGHIMNASGACMMGWAFGQAPRGMVSYAEYLTAVTGLNFTAEELNRTAERIANIRHAFNLREGIIELNWTVHPRIIGNPPLKEGPLAGVTADIVTQDAWNLGALDWDMISTKPSVNKLKQLGLEDLIPDIYPPKK